MDRLRPSSPMRVAKTVSVEPLVRDLRWPLCGTQRFVRLTTGTPAPNSSVTRLDNGDLEKVRAKLKAGSPRASSVCTSLRNVIEGRVEGHFYTDGWPEFTTVVFQCLQPRLSDVSDLHCYTTSKQQLCCVLEQARLVSMGPWQLIQIVEDDDKTVTDYVVQNLQPDGETKLTPTTDYSVLEEGMYALLQQLPTTIPGCPEGYRLGELAVEHSAPVSSQAETWIYSFGRPASVVELYCRQCIQRLCSAAAYSDSDPSTPVAWQMQHAHSGALGNLFTFESHRRKGLATAAKHEVCQTMIAQGDVPMSFILDGSPNIQLHSKLGFQHVGYVKNVYLHFRN